MNEKIWKIKKVLAKHYDDLCLQLPSYIRAQQLVGNSINTICKSYGNKIYAEQVIEYGKSIFGYNFIPLTEFMAYEEYQDFLKNINIAIFNHRRQQAMGNTISLLGMGKVVYLRKGTSQSEFFKKMNIDIYDIEYFSTNIVSKNNNKIIISRYFSIEKLRQQWSSLLNE